MHDANTVRRIAAAANLDRSSHVLEVGPGLGSLTLALLEVSDTVTAIEIDHRLAEKLPATVQRHAPTRTGDVTVITADALAVRGADIQGDPTALVANLPYNVAVPVLLHLLAELPSLRPGAGDGAGRGRRPAGGTAGVPHLRLAEREGGLVRDGQAGRRRRALGVLAGAWGRLGAGRHRPAPGPSHR